MRLRRVLYGVALMTHDFFGLFGLPVDFGIDKTALKAAFLQLQKQHHPDNSDEKLVAEQNTALINHAYTTLNRDDSRAVYLLEMRDVSFDSDKSIADESFLMQMMTHRMDLEDAVMDHDLPKIKQIGNEVSTLMTTIAANFHHDYQHRDWLSAQTQAQKLKFLANLHDDVTKQLHHQPDEADDDLYV